MYTAYEKLAWPVVPRTNVDVSEGKTSLVSINWLEGIFPH